MAEPIHFLPTADGFELRRGDVVAGRVGAADAPRAQAEAGGVRWELALDRDPERADGTWQVVALDEDGEQAAAYYHGGIRGGRVRLADGGSPALRRAIGRGTDWRLKSPDCALTLRPSAGPDGTVLELIYVPGSVAQPDLVLLLICWCVMAEEQMPPTPLS
jgi:hypothetical protein